MLVPALWVRLILAIAFGAATAWTQAWLFVALAVVIVAVTVGQLIAAYRNQP